MDTILICSGNLPAITSIYNTFIEDYMLSANGSYVKVYLYLSKCIQACEQDLSISSLADKMESTEKDILRALQYWEKNNLIYISRNDETNEITGIEMLDPDTLVPSDNIDKTTYKDTVHITHKTVHNTTEDNLHKTSHNTAKDNLQKTSGNTAENNLPKTSHNTAENNLNKVSDNTTTDSLHKSSGSTTENNLNKTSSQDTSVTNDSLKQPQTAAKEEYAVSKTDVPSSTDKQQPDINITPEQTKALAEDEEFTWTCRVIESYVNRPLNSKEIQLISYLYSKLSFTSDLLLHLYEYCISLGKTNVNYIQKVALSWDEQNVKTPEDAKILSTNYTSANSAYTAISKAFALGRPLAIIEKHFADRWQNEWHMDLAVILDACNRTMLKLQKADFKYAEGILDNWHKSNIHTLQDVEKADKIYAQKKAIQQTQKNNSQSTESKNAQTKNQFNSFQQRGTSQEEVDELEKKLLAH